MRSPDTTAIRTYHPYYEHGAEGEVAKGTAEIVLDTAVAQLSRYACNLAVAPVRGVRIALEGDLNPHKFRLDEQSHTILFTNRKLAFKSDIDESAIVAGSYTDRKPRVGKASDLVIVSLAEAKGAEDFHEVIKTTMHEIAHGFLDADHCKKEKWCIMAAIGIRETQGRLDFCGNCAEDLEVASHLELAKRLRGE